MSASDFNGRLLAPVIALPRRPLSRSESTASCSIRFSLRTMISGAFSSSSRRRRELRLMTRRYRSFKSEVAKRPPSSGTSGRRSGGSTGSTSRIIHSGLMPDCEKPSSTLRRLAIFLILASEPVVSSSWRSFAISAHFRLGHFDAALLAYDAAMLQALVLAAQALVILDRAEYLGAEQAVPLRLEGPVVDRFRLLDFAVGPRTDLLGRGQADGDGVEFLFLRYLLKEIEQCFHVFTPARGETSIQYPAARLRRRSVAVEIDVDRQGTDFLDQHVE